MNVFVYTLGCRVNQCESEAIAQAFHDNGHSVLKDHQDADLVIVNTCTVTSKAEQKARRVIRLYAAKAPTLVTGCYAQVNPKEIESLSDNVVVLPLVKKASLMDLPVFLSDRIGYSLIESLREFATIPMAGNLSNFDYAPSRFSYHCRSYLKVQDGCDNNCGFCRVHIARGPSSFLEPDIAVRRALEIESKGYHEIVLTGVNLTMYDHRGRGLGGLLERLLGELGPDTRLRLSSLEPDNIDDLLLKQLEDPRMQPYFHIPIQSAADKVIRRINRSYDSRHLEHVIGRIREIKDDPFLACDIITGLPAEGDEEFEITKDFLIRYGFALMHVFPFSPRPDTALANAKDKATEYVRDERARILRELSLSQNKAYVARQIGKDNEVILEEHKKGLWYGLTGNYIRTLVKDVPEGMKCGDLLKVRLVDADVAVAREE